MDSPSDADDEHVIVPVCATYPLVESHFTVQLVSEFVLSWMLAVQPSLSPATRPAPNEYAAHLFSTHTSADPLLSLV